MKAASVNELKQKLNELSPKQVNDACLRLIKYKKENKELLTYLLFEADSEASYIQNIKDETDVMFSEMNSSNLYYAKKTLRKILRMLNKYIRYSGVKQTEAELRIYFCNKLLHSGIPFRKSPVLLNAYRNQLKKIIAAVSSLHEDLQYDFKKDVKALPEY